MNPLANITQSQIMSIYKNLIASEVAEVGIGVKECFIDGVKTRGTEKLMLVSAPFTMTDGKDYTFQVICLIDINEDGDGVDILNFPFMYFTDKDGNEYRYNGKKLAITDFITHMAFKSIFNPMYHLPPKKAA